MVLVNSSLGAVSGELTNTSLYCITYYIVNLPIHQNSQTLELKCNCGSRKSWSWWGFVSRAGSFLCSSQNKTHAIIKEFPLLISKCWSDFPLGRRIESIVCCLCSVGCYNVERPSDDKGLVLLHVNALSFDSRNFSISRFWCPWGSQDWFYTDIKG